MVFSSHGNLPCIQNMAKFFYTRASMDRLFLNESPPLIILQALLTLGNEVVKEELPS
jgi:hypothetical protein